MMNRSSAGHSKSGATLTFYLYYIVLLEQIGNNVVRQRLLEQAEDRHDGREQELCRLLAIEQLARCIKQVTDM